MPLKVYVCKTGGESVPQWLAEGRDARTHGPISSKRGLEDAGLAPGRLLVILARKPEFLGATHVYDLRLWKRLSQRELSRLSGIPQGNLSKMERGLLAVTKDAAMRLLHVFRTGQAVEQVHLRRRAGAPVGSPGRPLGGSKQAASVAAAGAERSLGRKIRQLRIERGWSQVQLGEELGRRFGQQYRVSGDSVSDWECGSRRPEEPTLARIWTVLADSAKDERRPG